MSDPLPVLIAGGGIGGLALALALAYHGRRSRVLERQETPATAGAGIQLGPNGVRALRWLGVADALQPQVGEPEAIVVRAGASGRHLARLPLGRWIAERHGAPYWVMHRGDLYGALAAAAAAHPLVDIHTGFEATAVEAEAGQVAVRDATGRSFTAPVLIGADGLWSAVRQALLPGSVPRPAGAIAMRTVAPAGALEGLDPASIGLWLSPAVHVVHYPVRQGREIAVVVIAREADARHGRGWNAQVDQGRLHRRLAPFHPSLTAALAPAAADPRHWRQWTLYTLPPLPAWTHGRVVLLGDAAHPMLPYLAQGGALALEDAIVLAGCIHAAADPEAALVRFEALRAARAGQVQAASLRQGRIYHLPPPLSWARDAVLALAPGSRLMAGYDWLYAWRPPEAQVLAGAQGSEGFGR
ncbi:MAG: FAD-dependent monooxygenase [Hyphomicrobiaceae bacterium]